MKHQAKNSFTVWLYGVALAMLYIVCQFVTNHYGPGWAFISLLSLVFIAAVIEERKA